MTIDEMIAVARQAAGHSLRSNRRARGISRAELGLQIGCSENVIQRIEACADTAPATWHRLTRANMDAATAAFAALGVKVPDAWATLTARCTSPGLFDDALELPGGRALSMRRAHERKVARRAAQQAVDPTPAEQPVAEQPVAEQPVAEQPVPDLLTPAEKRDVAAWAQRTALSRHTAMVAELLGEYLLTATEASAILRRMAGRE